MAQSYKTTVAKIDDQKITLVTPLGCVAAPGKLAAKIKSTKRSKGAQLRFVRAVFYIGKGVKHKHHAYVANATKTQVPARLRLSLAGVKSGTHTLKVVVYYTGAVNGATSTVSKTLRVKFSVC